MPKATQQGMVEPGFQPPFSESATSATLPDPSRLWTTLATFWTRLTYSKQLQFTRNGCQSHKLKKHTEQNIWACKHFSFHSTYETKTLAARQQVDPESTSVWQEEENWLLCMKLRFTEIKTISQGPPVCDTLRVVARMWREACLRTTNLLH